MPKNLCLVPKIYVKMPFGQGLAQGGEEIRILIGQCVHFNLLKLRFLVKSIAIQYVIKYVLNQSPKNHHGIMALPSEKFFVRNP